MKMPKEIVKMLNEAAEKDFSAAKEMLNIWNTLFDGQYGWLSARVVYFDNPNGSVAEKYAHAHDAMYE